MYARSCHSAHTLGKVAVDGGAKAYIGYKEPFYMGYNKDKMTHPLNDEIADMFLKPSNQVVRSLLKGHSAAEASAISKSQSVKTIQQLITSDSSHEDAFYAKLLWSNMQSQICHGDGAAKAQI